MRLFIAVPLPNELTDRAAALLPPALPAVRRVQPELMHVTLAFLGWTPDEQLDAAVDAARAAAAGAAAFDLAFGGVGRFPASGRPRVVWLGVGLGADALAALAGSVTGQLRRHRIAFDDRPFEPHLTLARCAPTRRGPKPGRWRPRWTHSKFPTCERGWTGSRWWKACCRRRARGTSHGQSCRSGLPRCSLQGPDQQALARAAPGGRRGGSAPAEVVEGVRVAEHLGRRAPPVGQVQPPVAELVEIEEPDDLTAGAEGHEREAAGA
ncbi:MAG TPA: RNA 2',3'-cyclic phosphodiesterase [Chloroflexi bacterium]|nr:RNA 2',3'-cyclic phosphodiesterase [Chloroflexota bacterium]HAL25511.1 RNA 2',3'-cyclic phosphodiesterase [Chloroflexota bacterium]